VLRAPVGLFHTFLAAGFATILVCGVAQSEVNLTWEVGFYGAGHPETLVALLAGVLLLIVSVGWAAGGVLHVAGTRGGAIIVVVMSSMLIVPSPMLMKVLLGLCIVSGVFDLLPALPDAPVDDEDD
jgi:hypothetical protein